MGNILAEWPPDLFSPKANKLVFGPEDGKGVMHGLQGFCSYLREFSYLSPNISQVRTGYAKRSENIKKGPRPLYLITISAFEFM